MKTSIKNLIYSMSICCIFCACNNELEESGNQSVLPKETTMSFIYDGKLYTSQCFETEDTTIILDNSTKLIAEKLGTLPRLTTVVPPDPEKPIMYFDTPEDADKYMKWTDISPSDNITKAVVFYDLRVELFEDKEFGGWVISRVIPFNNTVEEWGLGGKNEKISSVKLMLRGTMDYPNESSSIVGAVKLFEDKYYGGNSIIFYIAIGTVINGANNLKNYPLYPGSKRNWGDKTCSYKAGFKNFNDLQNW